MLDSFIRPYINPPLERIGAFLARKSVSANSVTVTGFIIGALAFPALTFEYYTLALTLILLSRLADGLDGTVARHSQSGATDIGAYLDILCDFIFYAGIVFFFAVGRPEAALASAFLIFSFMGTAASFLTYGILAARRNMNHDRQGKKSFYYAAGLCEGTETIFFLILFCVFPDYFVPLAYSFGILCWITTAGRTATALKTFKD